MARDASCHLSFYPRIFLYRQEVFFFQSAVFIFVNQQTLLVFLVVSNQLIRKVAQL
jgi:hypothetical protein